MYRVRVGTEGHTEGGCELVDINVGVNIDNYKEYERKFW